jgi:hypothetical protein
METLCPSMESNGQAVHDELSLGGILRLFLPVLLHLLKLNGYKPRVLWQLAAWPPKAGNGSKSRHGVSYYHCVFTLPAELKSPEACNGVKLARRELS